jgi:hypothetical protein
MEVTEFGISTDVRLVHLLNVLCSIEVIELGNFTDVRLLHSLKAAPPMEVTESGITTDIRVLHPAKAELPILVAAPKSSADTTVHVPSVPVTVFPSEEKVRHVAAAGAAAAQIMNNTDKNKIDKSLR